MVPPNTTQEPTSAAIGARGPRTLAGPAVSIDEPKPASASRLALVALVASCVGWIAAPFGLLLVAWAFFVAGIIVFTNLRDGRAVPRAAYATLIISVLPLPLLHGSP